MPIVALPSEPHTGSYLPGTTTAPPLSATFYDSNGVLDDAAPVTFDLIQPNGNPFLTGGIPTHIGPGSYSYAWAIPSDAAPGVWLIVWHGVIDGEDVSATEAFFVGAIVPVVQPPPGAVVCQLWAQPVDIIGTWTDDEKTAALTVSSDVLYVFSGRQFPGLCSDTVRPTPTSSYDSPPVPIPGFGYRQGSPWGLGIQQPWQGCSHGWGCGETRIRLGAEPVVSITQVRIDGVVLDAATYQVDDHRWLAAVPDPTTGYIWTWPHCQYVDLPATAVGTFEVVYVFGRTVPAGGKAAAIALATQILKADTEDCQLPANVQQLIRQGVTISMGDPAVLFADGRTGLKTVDRWLASVNPNHLTEPGRVLSPDLPPQVVHART